MLYGHHSYGAGSIYLMEIMTYFVGGKNETQVLITMKSNYFIYEGWW